MIVLQGVSKVLPRRHQGSRKHLARHSRARVLLLSPAPPEPAKSTNSIKLLIRDEIATSGRVFVNHQGRRAIEARQIPHFRRKIGVVFRTTSLLAVPRPCAENVAFPLQVHGILDWKVIQPARLELVWLELVGLPRLPAALSGPNCTGGEQQTLSPLHARWCMRP